MLRHWLGRPKAPRLHARTGQAPLRVLHVGKFYPPYRGGMESFLADLIEQQRASGIDAYAVVHGDPLPDDPPWLIRVPVQITLVFAPIALGFPLALHRAIAAFKPDVLHLHMPNNAAFWALLMPAARRVAWVTHWHSDVLISKWDSLLQLCYQVYKPFETKLLRQSDAILATSPPYMAASIPLQRWLFKTLAIPLGLKPLGPAALEQAQTPPAALWGDVRLRVLSVGRLTYYKGFDTLISAVAGFADVQLLIAGEGEQRKELEALIARERAQQGCANVQLLGQVSEAQKHALFNSCDIFALASRERTEAFGLVLIEAMQHGKPCMASDLDGSGMSWVVGQSGSGQCYAPDQVQAWKEAIRQALAAKAQLAERGLVAQQAADAYFSIGQCERRIAEVYDSLRPAAEPAPALPLMAAPARPLQVAVVQQAGQWPALVQWQAAHPERRLLCVDASGESLAARPAQDGLATVSLADLRWPEVIELIQRLAEEQGLSDLSICAAADLWGQTSGTAATPPEPGFWQRWLARRGVRHLQLGQGALVLRGAELAAWVGARHAMLGRHLFMRIGAASQA